MRKYVKYIIPGVIIIALGIVVTLKNAAGDASKDSRRMNAPLVKVAKPTRETVALKLRFSGDVAARQQATIYSRIQGNLEKVLVNLGSFVKSNHVIAQIDSTEPFEQMQQTAATYQNARLTFQRSKNLLSKNLISKQEVDNLDATMKVALANHELAKTRLGYTRILAPFPGIITRRYLDPGTFLTTTNTPLFQLMDIDSVKILISILEKDIVMVHKGTRAAITVDAYGEKIFPGSVTRLSDALDVSTRTMAIELDIANKDHSLKPGMFATVTLLVEEHPNAITIPTFAIMKDDSGPFVYVSENSAAKRKRLKLGFEQESRTEVVAGLDGSESLIVVGQQLVKDGGTISIQQ